MPAQPIYENKAEKMVHSENVIVPSNTHEHNKQPPVVYT